MSSNPTGTERLIATVSAEAAVGETVTFVVRNPDGSQAGPALTAPTQVNPDGSITAAVDFTDSPGDYTFVPSIGVDAQYEAAQGAPVPFTIVAFQPRTISGSATQIA